MKKKEDIVDKAVAALENEAVPGGPPAEAVDAVVAKLAEAGGEREPGTIKETIKTFGFAKVAAAVALLVVAGYGVGRLTAARAPDMEQLQQALEPSLRSSLEPAIRQRLLEELNMRWGLALAGSYVRLKDELGEQFHREMNEFGVQILAASGEVTDRRLTELIEAINAAQVLERRQLAEVLGQMELERMSDLATFAVRTEDELRRTKQDVARWIAYTRPERSVPDESNNLKPSKERSEK